MEELILVDSEDREIGRAEKVSVHLGSGHLHRAFSIFIFDDQERLLVQQRAQDKMLWPGFWSNSCCSHPRPGEDVVSAAQRRLQEELGFSCQLKHLGSFIYSAQFDDIGAENELCHVLMGRYNGEVKPDSAEIQDIQWLTLDEIKKMVAKDSSKWTPWFLMELEKFF